MVGFVWRNRPRFFYLWSSTKAGIPFIAGVGLFVVPNVIANSYLLVAAGLGLIALPYYFRV